MRSNPNPEHIIISHVNDAGEIQTNGEHQQGVAVLAARFAGKFGMSEWGRALGLLHDIGKEKEAFQQHIMKESGLRPDIVVQGDSSHAYVGALAARKMFLQVSLLLGNALAGHHRGLYDQDELDGLMKDSPFPSDVRMPSFDANFQIPSSLAFEEKDIHLLERMLFSCLVDADYLDTEAFMQPDQSTYRGSRAAVSNLLPMLENHLNELRGSGPMSEVNRIRNYVQEQCIAHSEGTAGFYSLTVPTGGGKTLSSVLWALHHAKRNGLERIIISIPYTSIITQTAGVLRDIFGPENVLEHHSNVYLEDIRDEKMRQRMRLASENWDYPIVVTTNVQLFQSLFANRTSACRKLHNLVKSVIILDEVQTLPVGFLRPITDSLDTLHRIFGTSVLLTTASQPVLSGRIEGSNPLKSFDALPHVEEIIPAEARLYDKLRRAEITFDKDVSTHGQVAGRMAEYNRVLCVVNTRNDAREIYRHLPKDGITFHLSRMMCPVHIQDTILCLREALKADGDTPIRVVATQLIEAGVDIDFPIVMRQEAGLDSVLQAAGRCNREGRLTKGSTFVFRLPKPLPPGLMRQANNARINMGPNHDWLSPEAMEMFFRQLYSRVDNFDKADMKGLLYGLGHICYETAAREFRLIDDDTVPVVVVWKDSLKLIEKLRYVGPSYGLMKSLARYSVNVRSRDMEALKAAGAVEEVVEGVFCITSPGFYAPDTGLTVDNHWLEETIIV